MVFFNYALRKLNAKIVYYGPGLCGKTTNLAWIHDNFEGGERGKMISLATEGDRTIFFDLLPLEIGSIRGMEVTLQLYTVPGQVHYNSTRQLVLRGADGVVFVADSQRAMQSSNVDSFKNLQENLLLQGISLDGFPHVLQFNKRDLKDLTTIEELNDDLNLYSVPIFEATATEGVGVQETLEGIVKLVMRNLRQRYEGATTGARTPGVEDSRVRVLDDVPTPPPGPTELPPPSAGEPLEEPIAVADTPEPAEELVDELPGIDAVPEGEEVAPAGPPSASSIIEPATPPPPIEPTAPPEPPEEIEPLEFYESLAEMKAEESDLAAGSSVEEPVDEPIPPAILDEIVSDDPAKTIDFSKSMAADPFGGSGVGFEDEVATGVYGAGEDSAIDFDELKRLDEQRVAPPPPPDLPSAPDFSDADSESAVSDIELPEVPDAPPEPDVEPDEVSLLTEHVDLPDLPESVAEVDLAAPAPDMDEITDFQLDEPEFEPMPDEALEDVEEAPMEAVDLEVPDHAEEGQPAEEAEASLADGKYEDRIDAPSPFAPSLETLGGDEPAKPSLLLEVADEIAISEPEEAAELGPEPEPILEPYLEAAVEAMEEQPEPEPHFEAVAEQPVGDQETELEAEKYDSYTAAESEPEPVPEVESYLEKSAEEPDPYAAGPAFAPESEEAQYEPEPEPEPYLETEDGTAVSSEPAAEGAPESFIATSEEKAEEPWDQAEEPEPEETAQEPEPEAEPPLDAVAEVPDEVPGVEPEPVSFLDEDIGATDDGLPEDEGEPEREPETEYDAQSEVVSEDDVQGPSGSIDEDLFEEVSPEPIVVGNGDPWTEEEMSGVYHLDEIERAEQAAAIEAATARAVSVQAEDNQLHLRLQGTGAIVESGQVRALDIEVPVPGSWVGNRRVTLQLRLTLTPDLEDEDDGSSSPS